MRFAHAPALLLALVPLLVLVIRHLSRRRWWGHPAGVVWAELPVKPWPWRFLPDTFHVAALAALAAALADPRLERPVATVLPEGRAIVIVLDLSFSMQEPWGQGTAGPQRPVSRAPTRLDVLKVALKDFIALRRSDRIGLVVFSENAYVISPLTTDYDYLYRYIDMIDQETLIGEGYTAIGEGVAAATALLEFQGVTDGQRGIVLVFTDGESNMGRDPMLMVQRMHEAGHRGYLVGVDLPEYVTSRAQVQSLVEAYRVTGGRYYDAGSTDQLERAYQDVSALEASSLEISTRIEQVPVYHWAVATSLVLLGISLALRTIPGLVRLA